MHSTLAVTPDGLPVGLLAQEVVGAARGGARGARPQEAQAAARRPGEPEVVHQLAAVSAGRDAAPQTTLVSVGDREADIYALFLAPRSPRVELLVRAREDRWVRVARDEYKYIHGLRAELATRLWPAPAPSSCLVRSATPPARPR